MSSIVRTKLDGLPLDVGTGHAGLSGVDDRSTGKSKLWASVEERADNEDAINADVTANTAVRLSSDEYDAVNGATLPSASNVFATMANRIGPFAQTIDVAKSGGVLVYDSATSLWKNEARVFGNDFQQAADETETTTTGAAYVTKTTLTTGALTGTYRVGLNVEIKANDKDKQMNVRLYNVTDAEELVFDSGDKEENNRYEHVSGFAFVTFAGAAKTFEAQFSSPEGRIVTCRRARIEFWRVA